MCVFFTFQYLLYSADKIVDFVLPPDVLLLIRKRPDVVSRQEASTGRKKLTKTVHKIMCSEGKGDEASKSRTHSFKRFKDNSNQRQWPDFLAMLHVRITLHYVITISYYS